MATGLGVDPINEELAIRKLAGIRHFGCRLRLAAVEAQKGGDRGDHEVEGEVG